MCESLGIAYFFDSSFGNFPKTEAKSCVVRTSTHLRSCSVVVNGSLSCTPTRMRCIHCFFSNPSLVRARHLPFGSLTSRRRACMLICMRMACAGSYGDNTFVKMMWIKVLCVYLPVSLGFNVLFQVSLVRLVLDAPTAPRCIRHAGFMLKRMQCPCDCLYSFCVTPSRTRTWFGSVIRSKSSFTTRRRAATSTCTFRTMAHGPLVSHLSSPTPVSPAILHPSALFTHCGVVLQNPSHASMLCACERQQTNKSIISTFPPPHHSSNCPSLYKA